MHPEFQTLVDRAAALRLTETEMWRAAGLPYTNYWRARTNRSNLATIVRVIRKIEQALARLEQLPAVCATCERRASDFATMSCTATDCGLVLRHHQKDAA